MRNYTACRLVSLIGPRVSELCLLRMGDVRWELGRFGKVLLRGKGSNGRGKKERLVPLINGARELLDWWVGGPRWDFDELVNDPLAPLFPSERRNTNGSNGFVTTDTLRDGLAEAVATYLPSHAGGCPRTCCGTSPPPTSTATAWMSLPYKRSWAIRG